MKSNRGIDTKLAPYEDQNPKILQLKNRKKLIGTLGFYILKKLGLKMGPLLKIFFRFDRDHPPVYLVLYDHKIFYFMDISKEWQTTELVKGINQNSKMISIKFG